MTDLDALNNFLKPEDDRLTAKFVKPEMPVSYIMEIGRCGSTVFIQALANFLHQGYVGRVLAKHWLAPYIGSMLEKEILKSEDIADFSYGYGKTLGPHEPNEWGWFWQHWLGLERDQIYRTKKNSAINAAGLNQKLAAIESVKQAPLLFDNVYAKANIAELLPVIPKILLINLVRDPYYVCNSHINARINHLGDISRFYGHVPKNVEVLKQIVDPVEQVVAQIKSVSDELDASLALFPKSHIYRVDYQNTVNDLQGVIEGYVEFLEIHGVTVKRKSAIRVGKLVNRDSPETVNPEFKNRLDHFYEIYFGSS